MDKAITNGCKMLQTDISLDAYKVAHEENARLMDEATGWEDYGDGYQLPSDLALALVTTGEAPWHLPYFYGDVYDFLHGFYLEGRYLVAAFVARFLLETLPPDPLDPEIEEVLARVTQYRYELPPRSARSRWPASPEHYLSTLQWGMVPYALDAEMDRRAETKTTVALIRSDRHHDLEDRFRFALTQ